MEIKLKPVVYHGSKKVKKTTNNVDDQSELLKAMQVTEDPNELRRLMGMRSVAEVYRTLDKISIRREYHDALARQGLSLDEIITGIRTEALQGDKSSDRIKAWQILLKSLGLDKYEDSSIAGGGSWEEVLQETIHEQQKSGEEVSEAEYEVVEPELPERVKKIREEEAELTESIYDDNKQ